MISRKNGNYTLCLFLSFVIVLLFQNCDVRKPQVEDMSSFASGFSHSPIPSSCVSCHVNSRPAGAKTLALDGKSNLFFHNSLYRNDCVYCHSQKQQDIGKSWRNGIFNHRMNTGLKVTNCNECHIGNMPSGVVGTTQFNHNTVLARDCIECHKNVGANWSTVIFSHTPTPTSCNTCHNSARPSPTQYFPSNPSLPSLNLYVHASQFNGAADCVSCHTSQVTNVGVTWTGGNFNHKTATGATVSTCIDCHTGSRPTSHTAASMKTGDCISCHTNAGVNWSSSAGGGGAPTSVTVLGPTGTQLAAITIKHPTVQAGMSCTTCHTSYNATNSIKGFDHNEGLVLAANNSQVANSCYYCHFSPSKVIDATALTNNTTRSFVNGLIVIRANSHNGKTLTNSNSCLDCHSATSVPTWNTGTKTWTADGTWNGG